MHFLCHTDFFSVGLLTLLSNVIIKKVNSFNGTYRKSAENGNSEINFFY